MENKYTVLIINQLIKSTIPEHLFKLFQLCVFCMIGYLILNLLRNYILYSRSFLIIIMEQ